MAEINEATLDEIKSRTDLCDLIQSYGIEIRRSGSNAMACCPFHREKTPSFNINRAKGFYHCFGCGESGDAIKFVQKYEGLSFVEAVKKLASSCGVEIETRHDPDASLSKRLFALMGELAEFYHRCFKTTREAQIARDCAAKRRLDGKTCDDFLVGYAPEGGATVMKWAEKHGFTPQEMQDAGVVRLPERPGGSVYHRFAGRLVFPIRDRSGRVVAFSGRQLVEKKNSGKYVNSPETRIFKKGRVLFGFDRAAGNIARAPRREVICCEGQIDCIRLHVNGFDTAVASQGTAFTEDHARMIKRVADAAVLMYDDDAAGHKAAIKVASMLLAMEMPVRVASLPDGDDPDSFLLSHKPEELAKIVENAESVVSFQCRVERAKETNPGSIGAVARIVREVLSTIACCKSAVLRSAMVNEASSILSIPAAALAEDLAKTKPRQSEIAPVASDENADADAGGASASGGAAAPQDASVPGAGMDAARAEPPSARETAFMAFLLENEYDPSIAETIGSLLPPQTFSHDFTRTFAALWLDQTARGEDLVSAFADGLGPLQRGWFDKVLECSSRTGPSAMGKDGIAREFVRSLWCDALKRERSLLPAAGDEASVVRRMTISTDLKILQQAGWETVCKLVSKLMKG